MGIMMQTRHVSNQIVLDKTSILYCATAARYKREAERLRVQEDLAETEKKRNELRGLLAMYSNE